MVFTGKKPQSLGTFGVWKKFLGYECICKGKQPGSEKKDVTWWSVLSKIILKYHSEYWILKRHQKMTLKFCLIIWYATRNWMEALLKEFPHGVAMLELKRTFGSDSYLLFDKKEIDYNL